MTDAEPKSEPQAEGWKKRRMVRGRWRDPAEVGLTGRDGRVDRPISVKLTADELAAFDAVVDELGLNRNLALRIAARRIAGFLEVDQATLDALRSIVRQVTGIANNINQIARIGHVTQEPAYQAFMAERQLLGVELAEVEGLMQQVLDVGRRRSDGRRRLQEAAAP